MQSNTINLPTIAPLGLVTKLQTPQSCLSLRRRDTSSIIPSLQSSMRSPSLPLFKTAAATNDPTTVDYTSSTTSVFPAEACETIGGDACQVEMYPEAKLESSPPGKTNPTTASEPVVDREYLQYDGPKTVFPGEACDDLGGEFCDPEYQSGVY